MRFLKTNLCTEAATNITASSSNANFPVSNLKNPFRSKHWRSSGAFVIDSTNNKINFKESAGGSELTATLTAGTYSSATLQTEIKTRMQAVGASVYTIIYSAVSAMWTVSTAGAYLALLNTTGMNAATNVFKVSLGFPNTDKTGATSYTGSLIAIHTKESIVFDMITTQDISSVVILWPKEDGIRLSSTAVLKIEGSATNVWASPAVSQVLTINNDYMVASFFFAAVQSYRYWRVTIEDAQNPYQFVELGMVWIGENVAFNEPENGFKFTLTDPSHVSATDFGHEYVDEYPLIASLEFKYNYIGYSTQQLLENAFRTNGTKKPVLVVFDQAQTVFNKDQFLIYGKFDKTHLTTHISYDIFSGTIKIKELG
jgi:hypothetical protein